MSNPSFTELDQQVTDKWKDFPWQQFPGYVRSQRPGVTTSWIWNHGFDIELAADSSKRKWVCIYCLQRRLSKLVQFSSLGTQNVESHLFQVHQLQDPSGKRPPAVRKKEKEQSKNIASMLKLNAHDPREQQIANEIISQFDRDHFQRLLIDWVVDSNQSFRETENERLRAVFEYLNPSVIATEAHLAHDTIRKRILQIFDTEKCNIVRALKEVPGAIHIAWDGWRSRNRHALYGITAHYLDRDCNRKKLVLGLPELKSSHTGVNIASQIHEILDEYHITSKIGFITLDNASNNDTAINELGEHLGVNGPKRRIRCFGHILNLAAKALLFGHSSEAFEDELVKNIDAKTHELWRQKGPIGKLHNLVHWIHKSDLLTYLLRSIQEEFAGRTDGPECAGFPDGKSRDVVTDNMTRWLSQLYMMRRALILRPALEELVARQQLEWQRDQRNGKKAAAGLPYCLREESQLVDKDWKVIELFTQVLDSFEETLLILEGDGAARVRKDGEVKSFGNIWDVSQAFEFLLAELEDWKSTAEKYPDPEHFKININLGWKKLDEYYSKLTETPVYYTSIVLHPQYRWSYFEQHWSDKQEWVDEAKAMVRDLWLEYKSRAVQPDFHITKRQRVIKSKFDRHRRAHPVSPSPTSSPASVPDDWDEYERWLSSPDPILDQQNDKDNQSDIIVEIDPIEYWWGQRMTFPTLSKMALDVLTAMPMSADCERLFSAAGLMVVPLRNRLEASTIGITQTLRSWSRAGLICSRNPMVAVNEECWRSVQQHQEDRELWESMSQNRVHGGDI
jgi:hypothetical protein